MFASIKRSPITMSRLAIPESSDSRARRAVQPRRMSAFGEFFRVQERRGWVESGGWGCHSPPQPRIGVTLWPAHEPVPEPT